MLRLSILLSALVFSFGAAAPLSALDPTLPVTAVVSPVDSSYHSSLASITGTAADDVSVSAVELKIVREADGYFWDGAAFVAGETWNTASFADPNWSYAVLPVWVNGSSYTVISRAQDSGLNYSETYSTAVFSFDTGLPVSSVTVPSNGSAPALFSGISGTAADGEFGVAQVWVKLIRASDNMYWNGATSQWTVPQSWNLAIGTVAWNWAGPPQAAMTIGGTYFAVAAAKDRAGNDQVSELGASTFTFSGATRPPGCADAISVKSGGSGSYFYIQDALDAMSKELAGDTCIVVANDGSYSEEVTVQGFNNNGYRLIIMREPAGGSPQVTPPASSTAVFRIMNASVTLAGFDAIPSGPTPYGVYASSDNVILSSVSVVSAGSINLAGIRLAGLSQVLDSAVTGDFSHGIRLDGGLNLVARTSALNNSASYATLYLSGSSSNTVTGSSFSNLGGSAVELLNNSNRNLVDLSTITADSTGIAFHADDSDLNTLTRSYVANPSGYGAFLGFGADSNNLSSSTLVSGASSYFALKLVSVSSNSVAYNRILNPAGVAYTDVTGAANSVAHSTISGGGLVFGAAFLDDTYGASVTDSFVSGGAGLFVRYSTGAAVSNSVLVSTIPSYAALRLDSGVKFTAFGNTVVSTGTGILFGAGNLGALVVASNTVAGAATGLRLGLPGAGASLEISSLTFRNMAGASTGVEFTAGQFVSTFTGFAFNSSSMSVNVNALALTAGSRVTMRNYAGPRSGPPYETDPSGYVDWDGADITAPTAAILAPVNLAYLNSLPQLSGTANDNVAVASVTLSVLDLQAGLYWNGSVWGAGHAWLDASLWPSSWTYTNVPAWVEASSYVVTARAMDLAGNWSVVYATNVFTYDLTAPAAAITSPVTGTYEAFASVDGTASDARGVALVQVGVLRESDGQYWDGSAWAAGPLWNNSTGTLTWNYNGITAAALTSGTTYLFTVRAFDLAGNVSDPALAASTFTYVPVPVGVLSPGVFSGIGVSSLTVNWSTTHSTAAVYQVRLSSWAAESPYLHSGSTHTASLTFTGLTPDTSYYGFVSTMPGAGFIASGSGITLASAPTGVDFSSVAYTSATLVWAAGANPAWTVYEFELSTAPDFSGLTAYSSGAVTSAAFTGLAQWTQYYGRVRAVNGAGFVTPYVSAPFPALTLFMVPDGTVTGLAGSVQGVSSITWTWNSGSVSDADLYAYYSNAGVFIGTSAFGPSGSYEQTGLGPNAPAMLRVAGRNAFGQGPLAVSATVYTLAALPAAPSFTGVGYSSVTLNWTAGGNPAGTVYEYELSASAVFSGFVSSGTGTGLTKAFTGLLQGATYYGRVRAVNHDALPTAYVSPGSAAVTQVLRPSGLVSGLAGAALGVSSVSWSWNAGTLAAADYFVVYSGAGVQLTTAAFAPSALYAREGLGPNSPHMVRVAGRNDNGYGPLAESATVYTLALPPAAPAASLVAVSSAELALGLNGNPAGTELQLWRSDNNISFTSVYEGAVLAYTDPALAECSAYYYKARARNGAGVYSGFGNTLTFTTMASTPAAPGGFYAEALDGARVLLAWEPSPSPGVAFYALYYDNASGTVDYDAPLAVFSSTVTSWTTPALAAGSTYKFAVRAGGNCGTQEKNTDRLASAQAVGVLSGVRAAIKVPQTGKRVKGNRVTVVAELTLGLPSQVAQVRFQYAPSGTGSWTDIPAANPNHPNPDLESPYFVHMDADALGAGTYDLRAVATDIYGAADPAAPTVTIVVDPVDFDTSESVVSGEQRKEQKVSNTVTSTVLAGDDATALVTKVIIPSGAVNVSTVAVTLIPNPAAVPVPPAGVDSLNLALKVNLSNGQTQLAGGQAAALTFSYKDDDNNGIVDGTLAPVDRLRVYSAPDSGGAWTSHSTSVDKVKKTITCNTTHFSFFSVFAAPAASLSEIKVYPVPWQPGAGGLFDAAGVTFSGLPTAAKIRIYTITGELVRLMELAASDAGIKIWDGRNSEGHKVASGIYLAFIKSGSDERTVKVAVER
ncbi:MAG: fibronectin type III domain-containing protein [Elusimicrobiales bacterium]|nr:fibronectin type III domain-containing protein [Elusimicrobiales bacterium]